MKHKENKFEDEGRGDEKNNFKSTEKEKQEIKAISAIDTRYARNESDERKKKTNQGEGTVNDGLVRYNNVVDMMYDCIEG